MTSAHRPRRAGALTVAVATALAALLTVGLACAPRAAADEGGSFVAWINAARASAGEGPYAPAGDLTAVAAAWAAHLAATGVLAHNPSLRSQVHGWRYVGENVGVGPSASPINAAFLASAPHRANILDHDYTQVGVATATGGGRLWVVEVFRQPTGGGSTGTLPRPTPAPAPARTTPAPARPAAAASSAARTTAAPPRSSAPSPTARPATTQAARPTATPSARATTPSPRQRLRQRAAAAAAGAGSASATTPATRMLRFAAVMAAAAGG